MRISSSMISHRADQLGIRILYESASRFAWWGMEGEVMCCIYLDILSDVFKSLVDKCTKERRIVAQTPKSLKSQLPVIRTLTILSKLHILTDGLSIIKDLSYSVLFCYVPCQVHVVKCNPYVTSPGGWSRWPVVVNHGYRQQIDLDYGGLDYNGIIPSVWSRVISGCFPMISSIRSAPQFESE